MTFLAPENEQIASPASIALPRSTMAAAGGGGLRPTSPHSYLVKARSIKIAAS
jgi:hypothetical protein